MNTPTESGTNQAARQDSTVTVYTRPQNAPSDSTIRHLREIGVEYEEICLQENPQAKEQIKALGYFQAPVVVTQCGHHAGFRPDLLNALVA